MGTASITTITGLYDKWGKSAFLAQANPLVFWNPTDNQTW